MVSHLGSAETGVLDGCLLTCRGTNENKIADYHTEMSASVFLDWLKSKVFQKMQSLGKKCVLVLDRVTYRTMRPRYIRDEENAQELFEARAY